MPNAQSGFFEWVWYFVQTFGPMFLRGAGTTLLISLTGTLVGFLIGLVVDGGRARQKARIRARMQEYEVKLAVLEKQRDALYANISQLE